jgi:creatinine amidohydrolase
MDGLTGSGTRVLMSEMTWVEYCQKVKRDNPVVIVPVGALEQHGPHLPLSTDTLIPTEVSVRVARSIGAIVAPPLVYGYKSQPKSGGGNHFCGTTSLDASTFIDMVEDLLCELARHGVRKVAVVDGHYENEMFLTEGIDLGLRALNAQGIRDMKVVKCPYWEFITKATEKVLFPEGLLSWALEHGAVMETSVMLHLYPHMVRQDLIPDHPPAQFPVYDVYPVDTRPIPPDGVLSSAASATAEKGKIAIEQVVTDIVAALRHEFGGN